MSPISDLITRIKNAYLAGKSDLVSPHSIHREEVLKAMVKSGYIESYSVEEDTHKTLRIVLKYEADGKTPVLTGVKIFSKPSQRRYVKTQDIPTVMSGMGVAYVSTPKGIMTGREAKRSKTGGELLFAVW